MVPCPLWGLDFHALQRGSRMSLVHALQRGFSDTSHHRSPEGVPVSFAWSWPTIRAWSSLSIIGPDCVYLGPALVPVSPGSVYRFPVSPRPTSRVLAVAGPTTRVPVSTGSTAWLPVLSRSTARRSASGSTTGVSSSLRMFPGPFIWSPCAGTRAPGGPPELSRRRG